MDTPGKDKMHQVHVAIWMDRKEKKTKTVRVVWQPERWALRYSQLP